MILNFIKKIINFLLKNKCYFLVIFISLFFIVQNIIWLKLNGITVYWDDGWYLETSVYLYNILTHKGIFSFVNSFINSFKIKAPLISVLPIPYYLIFGKSFYSAMLVNISLTPIAAVYLFKIAKKYLSKFSSYFAVILLLSTPIVLSNSRIFMVEFLNMTLVIIWMYYLMKSNFLTKKKYNIILGIIGGLGMLTKVIFPLYIIIPTLIIIFFRIKIYDKKKITKKLIKNIALIIIITILVSSIWYLKNFHDVFWFMFANSFGSVAQDYSNGSKFDLNTILNFYLQINNYGLSFFIELLFIISIILIITKLSLKKTKFDFKRKIFLYICLTWFFVPLFTNSIGVVKIVRYLTPAVPGLILLIALFFDISIKSKKVKYTLLSFLSVITIYGTIYYSFDFDFLKIHNLKYNNFYFFQKNTEQFIDYLHIPCRQNFSIHEILKIIMENTDGSQKRKNVLIAAQHKNLNFNNLNYFKELYEMPLNIYTGTIQQEKTVEESANIIIEKSDFIIIKTENTGVDNFNIVNNEIYNQIKTGNLNFNEISNFSAENNSQIIIYKRLKN